MNQLEGLLLILFFPLSFLLSGYWLAARLTEATPSERLAVAVLAGLSLLLLVVSVVNFFVPLSLPWAGLALLPLVATLAGGQSRRSLLADLAVFGRDRETRLAGLLLGLFFVLLLWPMIADGQRVFYDGSPNHDSFFWVAAAEYLKRHTYMEPVVVNAAQPLFNATGAILGWKPAWGRMGAEGLLALASTLVGASPLKIYLYGTAALFLPWAAAVFLTAKTFFNRRLTPIALVGLALFQPVFIFFYSNANLPNLLGVLTGATAVLALEHALRTPAGQARAARAWVLLLALGMHGLFCSYPEMIPFVGLSCGFLWVRGWFGGETHAGWRRCLAVAGGAIAGILINPATTIRAYFGFIGVLGVARANQNYASLIAPLSPGEYLPGLASLAIPSAKLLGDWVGWLLSLVMLACLGLAFWRARDRFGALAIFAGSGAMLAYTIATDFTYGWQKTVQFGGVFVAAVVPVAVLDALARERQLTDFRRWLAWAGTVAIALFMALATVQGCLDIYKWSTRKVISQDWFAVREASRDALRAKLVTIDSSSFSMGFFHGMWAAYFLPESHLTFATRDEQAGGYLRSTVRHEEPGRMADAQAVLVGRLWADAFDPATPRLLQGREFALLSRVNRVTDFRGVYPHYGLPDAASTHFALTLQPNYPAHLSVEIAPHEKHFDSSLLAGSWQVTDRLNETETRRETVTGPALWRIEVPLTAGQFQTVRFDFSLEGKGVEEYPFKITRIRLVPDPRP